mgnify:FL=1
MIAEEVRSDEFFEIVNHTLEEEGGYVNDPTDKGGETNYGISKRAYPDLNIFELTEDDAIDIYWKDYWLRGKCDKVPVKLQAIYFDMCVNFGISGAIKVLQETANGKGANIEVDGKIGPNTIKAIQGVSLERVRAFRVLKFAKIVINKPEQIKFWYGWYRRSLKV